MFGLGVVKGLGITLKHFIDTYVDDIKYFYFPSSATSAEAFARRQGPEGRGIFTVEYPEMKLQTPENFRFLPFLITDYDVPADSPDYDRSKALEQNRCTSCGICAKVCPPQCIWIVRTDDPKTGKPIPQPAEFYIDTDICMNCGYCAEFCPFDAIKMDHDFELADYEREVGHVHDLDRLLKPISYYAAIRPTWNAKEEAARRAAEEEKERKAAEKAAAAKATPAAAPAETAPAVEAAPAGDGPATPQTAAKRSPEEIKAMREAMMAKKQQRAAGEEAAPAANAEGAAAAEIRSAVTDSAPTPEAKPQRSPEEIKAQREAMMAKRAQRALGGAVEAESEAKAEPTEAQAETRPLVRTQAPTAPDDLKVIEGIGPKIAALLQAAGITNFAQLAETEVSRLEQLLVEANLRRLADPATWPEQARLAAAGDWEAFKALTEQLKGGRRA
ncbi:MAG: 4Fe-4S ferredoxin [Chloroflexota bacterium]|nr:MAG: 4Fe-4S ferredoxin [Chloroflexota bacterium]